ncbi:ubiquitin-like domain-containing protein [Thalassiella azotivora]
MPGENDVRNTVLKLPRSRTARLVGQAAVLVALVGGTAAYAANDTTVQLTVDGQTEEVRVFGTTVDDVLETADVELGDRDLVAPSLGERVSDGSEVVVRHARLLTLTIDGVTEEHWTYALTVDEALQDLDVRADGARLSASRSTPLGRSGLTLQLVTPKPVTLVADGQTRELTTTAADTREVLAEAGVTVGELDRLTPAADQPVLPGMVVRVFRVAHEQVTEETAIPHQTQEVPDGELYEGETKVETEGVNGRKTVTSTIVRVDGAEESREVVSEAVTAEPVTEVVRVGTKEKPAAPSAPTVPDGSVWDRLAQCESGGNWQINTGNGYYGGLQFSASSWRAVGGTGLPHEHSREVQIQMGERLQARQGWGAWPSCSAKLGLR